MAHHRVSTRRRHRESDVVVLVEIKTRSVVERKRGLRGNFSSVTELREEINSLQADTTREASTVE